MSFVEQPSVLRLQSIDNVCVAVRKLDQDTKIVIDNQSIRLSGPVEMGHKIATRPIGVGEPVVKYGQVIGYASRAVLPGDWVHTHNLQLGDPRQVDTGVRAPPRAVQPVLDRTFRGYRRAGGKTGTRNTIAVLSSVNCSASVSKYIARRFGPSELRDFPNVDGVFAVTHGGGCGMPFGGTAHAMLNRVLAGFARHPNVGAYVLVGLGCEQAEIDYLLKQHQLVRIGESAAQGEAPPVLMIQDLGGTTKTVEAGVEVVRRLLPQVNDARREEVPASDIILAVECGGSDGHSGITANPALGAAADLVVACGGTVILSETTEIYGAEQLLTCRARSAEVAEKLLDRIRWWKHYVGLFGAELDNNPSVGNKRGGLTTIAEKSLGAIAKGGSTVLEDVVQYAEPVTAKGLVVMDTPGYDPASVTGKVAGGANIVVFTTGRGSCFGCKPAPSIKVATNTPMFQRMIDDMDINAGTILTGAPVAQVGQTIFDEILAVASGKRTKSELLGIGDEEYVPWTVGPML